MVASGKERNELRNAALAAGIALIIMTLAAFFSYGYVHGSLVAEGDAAATVRNIASSGMLFHAEILGWLVILICDIIVAWAFSIYLKPVHRSLSLLCAWLRLIYTAILAIAVSHLLLASLLANGTDALSLMETDRLAAQVMLELAAFDLIWSVGLIVFGAHLLLAGWLALRSGEIPKLLGVLLLIASIGYMIIHLGSAFLPQYGRFVTVFEYALAVPMTAGELGFGLWLLFKGGKASAKA
ncbi:DUF4386 domain-containing protein [Paenibacillus arenilitoris]|uniref:DUF4386 domain-containing protein n=1 Tax=Paenibacillus arenilitoris TaxID=2772299 RepID=A0A927H772_9BACL|nr:DUF4386 domain-containing protein [Paenibacillus arenilitoris]MBD2870348.1 DUF4386 domain-containing protein [Paenibacillus arenilitoris]